MCYFCIFKINLMLRKITVGNHVLAHGPTVQNPPLVRISGVNVGPTTVLQLLKLLCWANVRSMSARQR